MKFTKEQLWTIRFGLGIAQAWQDQRIDNGEASCITKSYLWDVMGMFDRELEKEDPFIVKIRRLIYKMER